MEDKNFQHTRLEPYVSDTAIHAIKIVVTNVEQGVTSIIAHFLTENHTKCATSVAIEARVHAPSHHTLSPFRNR